MAVMMNVGQGEVEAIRTVVDCGKRYGYGNLICHLQSAWMASLIDQGLGEDTAKRAVIGQEPYPVMMHEDVVLDGCWDVSGDRYGVF